MQTPSFQAPNFEIPNDFRDFAEKSVDQARNAVTALMSNAVKAAEQARSSGQTFQSTVEAALAKGFDHAQTNANATFDFAQKLVRTRDLREAVELQSDFVRSQFAALQAQAKDYGALVQNAAR